MYPSVATESVLFGTDVSLGHGEYMCDSVECCVVLADTPFLRLHWIESHVLVLCWSWGVVHRTVSVMHWRKPIGYAFFINPMA